MKGTVKFWNRNRGYGFIERDDNKEVVFVHFSQVQDTIYLNVGEKVSFDIEINRRANKPQAINVELI